MITEKAYLPVFKRTFIKNFESFETRGTWEVQGDFMGGPFINYLVKDSINNRTAIHRRICFFTIPKKERQHYRIRGDN